MRGFDLAGPLLWLAMAAYLAGSAGYLIFIFRQRQGLAAWSGRIMALGLALHTGQLIAAWLSLGHVPAISLSQSFSFFAWAVVAGYLVVQLRTNVQVLGSFVAPLALLLMILGLTGPAPAAGPAGQFGSLWLTFHVTVAFLGDGFLAVAFVAGVMYLLQEGQIRNKRFGWLYGRLPSLTSLDGLNQTALLLGFPLLTVGILSGALYAQMTVGAYWRWDAKEVWSLITWIVYAVLLHQRLTVGWRGRKAAWLAIVGFGAVVFTFLGASLVLTGYHDFKTFGWKP